MNPVMNIVTQICGLLVCLFVGALGAIIIVMIAMGKIDLRYLVSEANGDASMSRFQLLIFTFVVAIGLFKLIEMQKEFPNIPNGVLTLLGISASTYAVGKGISYSRDEGVNPRDAGAAGDGNGAGDGQSPAAHAAAARDAAERAAAHARLAQGAVDQNPRQG